jgi:hypothetical protein
MRCGFLRLVGLGLMLSIWTAKAAPSPELAAALAEFRTEGPKGWAYTQATSSPERSRVESFDPLQPYHLKWTLVAENDAPPSESEQATYRQQHTRRSGGETAPNVKEQMDYETAELISDDGIESVWNFRLQASASDDSSAEHMAARLVFHQPTSTITQIQLHSLEPFSPVLGVKIETARTTIDYSLPTDELPSLLRQVAVHIRGRAFFFKSLDSDLTVSYSEYRYAGKR